MLFCKKNYQLQITNYRETASYYNIMFQQNMESMENKVWKYHVKYFIFQYDLSLIFLYVKCDKRNRNWRNWIVL